MHYSCANSAQYCKKKKKKEKIVKRKRIRGHSCSRRKTNRVDRIPRWHGPRSNPATEIFKPLPVIRRCRRAAERTERKYIIYNDNPLRMDPCPGGRFTVLRPSMRPSPSDALLSNSSPARFFLNPRSSESHESIEHAAVSSESCVYIGAGLAMNSCLFRGIMVTRKWKRISRAFSRRTGSLTIL